MIGMGKIEDDVKPGNTFNRQRVRSGLCIDKLESDNGGKICRRCGKARNRWQSQESAGKPDRRRRLPWIIRCDVV